MPGFALGVVYRKYNAFAWLVETLCCHINYILEVVQLFSLSVTESHHSFPAAIYARLSLKSANISFI